MGSVGFLKGSPQSNGAGTWGVRMGQKNAFSFNSLKPNVGFVLCQGFLFFFFPPLFRKYCFLHNNTIVAGFVFLYSPFSEVLKCFSSLGL